MFTDALQIVDIFLQCISAGVLVAFLVAFFRIY